MTFWVESVSRDVHKCRRRVLDSNKQSILSIALIEKFRRTRITPHCPFHESSLSILHLNVVGVILLQIGMQCLSMRMTLDLLHEFSNTEVFCLFHNCIWQSRHSEVNVHFLAQCEQTGGCSLSTGLTVLT